ncbi:MAG: S9 family peptidase, partial [Gammaproteobacteria bacterium]|nr:S9 family peptidase [Gammaproteobacteria bacterium]
MRTFRNTCFLIAFVSQSFVLAAESYESLEMPEPPKADRRAHTFSHHGIEVEDPYAWLRDASYPKIDDEDVLAYLRLENAYFDAFIEPLKGVKDGILSELLARLEKNDWSVPFKDGDWFYQTRFHGIEDYPVHVRWPATLENPKTTDIQVLIDERAMAEGVEFFNLGTYKISPDDRWMAYTVDTDGSERYQIRIKDLKNGELLTEIISDARTEIVWSTDNLRFFYVLSDENWRPYQIKEHTLGADPKNDRVVYEESDPGFFLGIEASTSEQFLIISGGAPETSEVRIMPLDADSDDPQLVSSRTKSHEYSVDHQSGRFVILSNRDHKDFEIFTAPEATPQEEHWTLHTAGSDTRYIQNVVSFDNYIVVAAMEDGLQQISLIDRQDEVRTIDFEEPAYAVYLGPNAEKSLGQLRFSYSSLVTPSTVFDYDLASEKLITRKTKEIPGGYQKEQYASERLLVKVRDGTKVPVSLVYRKDLRQEHGNPLYLYGYGAYGYGIKPSFSTTALSLLDRGFVYAIAHIRGGDELGYKWKRGGKLDQRTNTFNDFEDVARHLITTGYTQPGRIAIAGGSAGGSLMGAVSNNAPELWGAVVSHVPFVDILSTMLDKSLPLTPGEWDEWGNPITDKTAFEYLRSYSPYDQISKQDYPPMLVTAGLNDP